MSNRMKDSGVAWIGKIPEEWSISKVKYLATGPNGIFKDGDWIESDVIEDKGIRYLTSGNVGEGVFKRQGNGYISEETLRRFDCLVAQPGDLMMSRLNLPIGRACIIPKDESIYVVAVDNVILRGDCFDTRYMSFAMNCCTYAEQLALAARGSTMKRVSRSLLGNAFIWLPPLSEQRLIADFLDEAVNNLDQTIALIEKQIDILERYKKSLIHEAVTKGLDPNTHLKPSGVEWIGNIPEHWNTKRLKFVASLKTGQTPPTEQQEYFDGDIKWYTPGDITGRYLASPERMLSNKALSDGKAPKIDAGSILLVGIGATAGKTGYLETAGSCNQQITAILPCDEIDDRYLYWQISSNSNELLSNALFTTLPIINNGYLGNWMLAIPPQAEQTAIADYLDKHCDKIDAILEIKRKQVEVLKKRRQSLIYEYVTGKRRVGEES